MPKKCFMVKTPQPTCFISAAGYSTLKCMFIMRMRSEVGLLLAGHLSLQAQAEREAVQKHEAEADEVYYSANAVDPPETLVDLLHVL